MDIGELQGALRRKLNASEDRRSHHVFFWMEVEGRDHRVAKFSHSGRGQLPQFVVSDTARRLRLRGGELQELVDCPLSGEQFLELWRARSAG